MTSEHAEDRFLSLLPEDQFSHRLTANTVAAQLDNAEGWSHPVVKLRPSLGGLFDIHGNLQEWCHDWYENQLSDGAVDPLGAEGGSSRVFRGGGWRRGAA